MLVTQTSSHIFWHTHRRPDAMPAASPSNQQQLPKVIDSGSGSGSSIPPTTTTPANQPTSVFNTLGSYADRIRESSGSSTTRDVKTSPHPASAILSPEGSLRPTPPSSSASSPILALTTSRIPLPNGHTSIAQGSSSINLSSLSSSNRPQTQSSSPTTAIQESADARMNGDDDGSWETVQTVRIKHIKSARQGARHRETRGSGTAVGNGEREEGSRANASRNWREKKDKGMTADKMELKEKDEAGKERSATGSGSLSKQTSKLVTIGLTSSALSSTPASSIPPTPTRRVGAAKAEVTSPSSTPTSTLPAKSVWGMTSNTASSSNPTTNNTQPQPPSSSSSTSPAVAQGPKHAAQQPPIQPSPSLHVLSNEDRALPSSSFSPNEAAPTATSVSVTPSVSSPNLSAETVSTAPTSIALNKPGESDDEIGSWRAKPKKQVAIEEVPTVAPMPRMPAPPPTVNAWDLRKKRLAPPAEVVPKGQISSFGSQLQRPGHPEPSSTLTTSAPGTTATASTLPALINIGSKPQKTSPGPVLQSGSFNPASINTPDGVNSETTTTAPKSKKSGGGKKKGSNSNYTATDNTGAGAGKVMPPSLTDESAWPDVAKAAEESARAVEVKKSVVKKEKEAEKSIMAEEFVGAGKKQKWTPIPAAELQEAADKAAENNRRQAKANKRGNSRSSEIGGSPTATTNSNSNIAGRGRKHSSAGGAGSGRGPRQGKTASTDEIRFSAHHVDSRGNANGGVKFGNVPGASGPAVISGTLVASAADAEAVAPTHSLIDSVQTLCSTSALALSNVSDASTGREDVPIPGAVKEDLMAMSTTTSPTSSLIGNGTHQISRGGSVTAPTSASAPLSRQSSRQDLHRSQPRPHSGPATSERNTNPTEMKKEGSNVDVAWGQGTGTYERQHYSTAPIPQHGFNTSTGAPIVPRPPRGRVDRDGAPARGGYGGRGRGGYRSSSSVPGGKGYYHGYHHQQAQNAAQPQAQGLGQGHGQGQGGSQGGSTDGEYGNLYQRGFGMGYSTSQAGFNSSGSASSNNNANVNGPNGSLSAGASPISNTPPGAGLYLPINGGFIPSWMGGMYLDPALAGQAYAMGMGMGGMVMGGMGMSGMSGVGMGGMNGICGMNGIYTRGPAPPLPVTMVPALDPLRSFILGQVEYYFSMQNLAMDVFLRQQMDSEGWIDISMIASFNRVKNLTTDLPLIKEVMKLSSLLEVRDDSVRLAHGDAKQYVLPGAKPTKFTSDSASSISTGGDDSNRQYPPIASESQQQRQASYSSITTDDTDPSTSGASSVNILGGNGVGVGGLNIPTAEAVAYEMFPSAVPGSTVTSPRRINPGDVESALMKSSSSAAARAATSTKIGPSTPEVQGQGPTTTNTRSMGVGALGLGVGINNDIEINGGIAMGSKLVEGEEVGKETKVTPDTSVAADEEGGKEQDEEAQASGVGAGLRRIGTIGK